MRILTSSLLPSIQGEADLLEVQASSLTRRCSWVQTDMGNAGAKGIGMEAAPTTLEDSTTGLVKVIDELKRGDKLLPFIDFEGVTRPF